jgi:hypothetical protein
MAPTRKPLKPKRILERTHQYRVTAERLLFHLERENLTDEAAELVRTIRPSGPQFEAKEVIRLHCVSAVTR